MTTLPTKSQISYLESKLAKQEDDDQRLVLLDQLSGHYVFLNVRKAQKFLAQMLEILERRDFPDFKLNYHWNSALIENQLYNFKLAEFHFADAVRIIEERGNANQQANVYIDYAGTCMNLGQKEKTEEALQTAQKLLNNFPDERLTARLICRQGFWNLLKANYGRAIELFLEADKQLNAISEDLELKDYYFLTLIHSGLGKVYEQNEEHAKSVRAYLKVVQMSESMSMRTRLSWHFLNVGNGFMTLKDQRSAEVYFKKAIRATDDISQHTRASAYANLGFCYFTNQKYREALEFYNRAEQLYKDKKEDDYFNFANIEVWRAYVHDELGKKKRALKHFFNALDYSKKTNDYRQLSGILKDIATFYAELGDYKNAFDYQVLHDQVAAKNWEQINSRKIYEMEVKYEAEKKEGEAELLRLQATRLQLKALRAQMNPHFVFNALNSIQSFISINNVSEASKYLSKFAFLMRQSLEYSDLEIISMEQEIDFLNNYLTINAKLRFEDRLAYEISVDDEIEEDIMGVPTMIVQPYVENAIEHGLRHKKKGLIKVSFSLMEDEETILCVVEDNGVGREKARELKQEASEYRNFRSLGTNITEQRLQLLHRANGSGKVFVNTIDLKDEISLEPLGTRVEISIPIVEIQMKKII